MDGEVGVEDGMIDAVNSFEMFDTVDVVVALDNVARVSSSSFPEADIMVVEVPRSPIFIVVVAVVNRSSRSSCMRKENEISTEPV
jgi:hypothetical protein